MIKTAKKQRKVFNRQITHSSRSWFSIEGEVEYIYDTNGLLVKENKYVYQLGGDDGNEVLDKKLQEYTTYEYTTLANYLAHKNEYDYGIQDVAQSAYSGNNTTAGGNIGAAKSGVKKHECANCKGTGKQDCNACDKKGRVLFYYDINHNPIYRDCPICDGSGQKKCPFCDGKGER